MVKPRILFILHIPPPVHGAAMVGKYIKESGIINGEFDADFINLSTSSTLTEVGKGGLNKIIKLQKIQLKIFKALLIKKYDLCYVTLSSSGQGFYKDLGIVFIVKMFGKKIIYHFHNKGVDIARKKKLNDRLYRYVFKDSLNILLSPHLYYDIKHYVKEKNVFYCPNGIPGNDVQIDLKPAEIIDYLKPYQLLYLGNMMVEKGVYILLEACKILKEKKLNFECHFVGGWSDIKEDEFKDALTRSGLSHVVFSHGPKYNEEKNAYFADSDVFVFPTFYHNEAFPLVILEAMQHGLPVVSTIEGGIPDEVLDGDTGFIVPQKNADMLADKLELLIKNPELGRSMGSKGAERFKEFFTIKRFEQNLTCILKEAIKR